MAILAAAAPGQIRLVDRIETPLVYLCAEAPPADGSRSALALLDDPALGALFGIDGQPVTGTTSPITQLRQLLQASTGELELAVTGLLPRDGTSDLPLLMCRARLSEAGHRLLDQALDAGRLATPVRRIGDVQIHALHGTAQRPGSTIELALVEQDLLVGNHRDSMDAAFGAVRRESAVLGADPRYRSLRGGLEVTPGSLTLYVDWQRVWQRIAPRLLWAERLFADAFGLGGTRRVLLAICPTTDAFRTTALLDRGGSDGGLFDAVEPVAWRQLLDDQPLTGLASLTLSIDPKRLSHGAAMGPARMFHTSLVGGCRRAGLDLDNQVLPRLGRSASCRLDLVADDDRRASASFSIKARHRRAAEQLFADLRRRFEALDIVPPGAGADATCVEVALADGKAGSIGVVGESVVLGLDPRVVSIIAQREQATTRGARSRQRVRVQNALQQVAGGRRKVVGVFELDFQGGRDGALEGWHVGLVLVDGGQIRLEMITPI